MSKHGIYKANLIFQYVIVITGGLSENLYLTLTGIAGLLFMIGYMIVGELK